MTEASPGSETGPPDEKGTSSGLRTSLRGVPLADRRNVVVVSRRAGNIQPHPEWGVLFDQIWVR